MHIPLQPWNYSHSVRVQKSQSKIVPHLQVHLTLCESCEHLPLSFVRASRWRKRPGTSTCQLKLANRLVIPEVFTVE